MGFFSGLVSSPTVKTPASGLYAQTPQYQQAYGTVANNTNSALANGQINAGMFTNTPLSAGGQAGLDSIYQGSTPTADSLQSDISMLTNPYDDSVINGINQQATGQNSLVNQQAAQAGQQGSNRSFLGTSDVEQNRLNAIGTFKQSQYNNAVNQSLGALTNSRRADAEGAYQAGTQQQQLANQDQQAPYTALQAQQGLLPGISAVQGNQAGSYGGGFSLGQTANTLGNIGKIASFFSDENLKENIEYQGNENGHNIYKFNYKSDPSTKWIGVMAQEIEKTNPDAVSEVDGYKAVDYDKIGVKFREAV